MYICGRAGGRASGRPGTFLLLSCDRSKQMCKTQNDPRFRQRDNISSCFVYDATVCICTVFVNHRRNLPKRPGYLSAAVLCCASSRLARNRLEPTRMWQKDRNTALRIRRHGTPWSTNQMCKAELFTFVHTTHTIQGKCVLRIQVQGVRTQIRIHLENIRNRYYRPRAMCIYTYTCV